MDFNVILPLETMSIMKVLTTLWQKRLQEAHVDSLNLEQIEQQVKENIELLRLPESCKVKLSNLIRIVSINFQQFKAQVRQLSFNPELLEIALSKIIFTSKGTINLEEIMRIIVKEEKLPTSIRYTIACKLCLVEDIVLLWKELSEDSKNRIYNSNTCWLVKFWSDPDRQLIPNRQCTTLPMDKEIFEKAFYSAIKQFIVTSTEYFLGLLPEAKHNFYLKEGLDEAKYAFYTLPHHAYPALGNNFTLNYNKTLLFLFSKFDQASLPEVVEEFCTDLLNALLCFPYQGHFLRIAREFKDYIQEYQFHYIIKKIAFVIDANICDCDYVALFREFWSLFPETHKNYVLNLPSGLTVRALLNLS